ncbi:MAG: hypothetical protein FWB75_06390, partial [Oscillospiraceae bacterium]|nr:hypothetical protein [Oscillospiraceae bacterium]
MIYFFIMLIVVGTVLELISLRRSTAKISVEFEVSVYSTQPGVPFEIKTVVTNQSLMPISYLAVAQTYPLHAKLPDKIKTLPRTHSVSLKKICRVGG